MSKLKDFIDTGIKTSQKIGKAFVQTSHTENISQGKLFGSWLKQSVQGAIYMLKKELSTALTEPESLHTSDKVAILISGYNLTGRSLEKLQKELNNKGVHVVQCTTRLKSHQDLRHIVKEIYDAIEMNPGKKIVLFGYSSGGIIAHRIGSMRSLPSISYGMPTETNRTMVGTLLTLYKKQQKIKTSISPLGKNIIEGFSEMAPELGNPSKTERLSGVHTHMSLNQKRVIDHLTKEIIDQFNKTIE